MLYCQQFKISSFNWHSLELSQTSPLLVVVLYWITHWWSFLLFHHLLQHQETRFIAYMPSLFVCSFLPHLCPSHLYTLLTSMPFSPLYPSYLYATLTSMPFSPLPFSPLYPSYLYATLTSMPFSPLCPSHLYALLTSTSFSSLPFSPLPFSPLCPSHLYALLTSMPFSPLCPSHLYALLINILIDSSYYISVGIRYYDSGLWPK